MSKHTPGPWKLEAGRSFATSSGKFYLSYGSDEDSGLPYFESFTELDANARLIAAAPELLDVVRAMANMDTVEDVNNAKEAARDLLARIEGTP